MNFAEMTITELKKAKRHIDEEICFRYKSAYEELEKNILDLINNFEKVYIIHGFGTGKVREEVWKCLKEYDFIKEYRFGGENEGLNGSTVVILK